MDMRIEQPNPVSRYTPGRYLEIAIFQHDNGFAMRPSQTKRRLNLGGIAIAMALFISATSPGQTTGTWIGAERQQEWIQQVRAVLPSGSSITRTQADRTPDDWSTLDHRGIEINGQHSGQPFQIWILPKDWVGIRNVQPNRKRVVYWEGILGRNDFKLIANTDDVAVHESLQSGLNAFTVAITNGGAGQALALFKDREIDALTLALAGSSCASRACRDEAAYSLVLLGVPAPTLTQECAARGSGRAQELCASALGYLGGAESVRVLKSIVAGSSYPQRVMKYAAHSLNSLAERSAGPDLLQGLHSATDPDTRGAIVMALEAIRYDAAAPAILSLLVAETSAWTQSREASALATFRYIEAVPAIRRLSKTATFTPDWLLGQQRSDLEIALMRLKEPWGKPADGLRLLLLAPEPSSSQPRRAAVALENVSDKDLAVIFPSGSILVDGKEYEHFSGMLDGNPYLAANSVWQRTVDLPRLVEDGNPHRVEYRLRSAVSNTVTVQLSRK